MQVDDLVKRGDLLYKVVRAPYTARFLDAQDYEMIAHGMGEYAGVYGSAIDVMIMSGPDVGTVQKKRKAHLYAKLK
tara:strand:+ start:32409 stop:32636 length:228 start_codon:yes stop_codon:yes gene_type:complete